VSRDIGYAAGPWTVTIVAFDVTSNGHIFVIEILYSRWEKVESG